MRTILFICFSLVLSATAGAQSLDFLGLNNIHFGMKSSEMKGKVVIMDSTSVYKDTAVYLRNTRCHLYQRPAEKLDLRGFTASRIEYQFCDEKLSYVFIYVNGNAEIDKAVAELKKTFKNLGCKGELSGCDQMDASAKGIRCLVNIDRKTQRMNFVLITKKAR
jgi:hypothetical protein